MKLGQCTGAEEKYGIYLELGDAEGSDNQFDCQLSGDQPVTALWIE